MRHTNLRISLRNYYQSKKVLIVKEKELAGYAKDIASLEQHLRDLMPGRITSRADVEFFETNAISDPTGRLAARIAGTCEKLRMLYRQQLTCEFDIADIYRERAIIEVALSQLDAESQKVLEWWHGKRRPQQEIALKLYNTTDHTKAGREIDKAEEALASLLDPRCLVVLPICKTVHKSSTKFARSGCQGVLSC